MYYKGAIGQGGPMEAEHRIFTASSTDGLNWVKEGLVIDGVIENVFAGASVPDAIVLPDGRIR
ncbi:hypothetical protein MYX84_10360, partial [Acidobacteria bacterium AH-259-O06]|nr:hypothetical protein [Acidobacteria bacterium AH-259-O06]